MLDKLQIVKQRYDEVSDLIIQPDIITDQKRYIQLNKEYKDLGEVVKKAKEYESLLANIAEAKEIIKSTKSNIIKEFSDISVRNGPYGPYIKKGSKFTPIPKDIDPKKLTKKECLDIIKNYVPAKFSKGKGKK